MIEGLKKNRQGDYEMHYKCKICHHEQVVPFDPINKKDHHHCNFCGKLWVFQRKPYGTAITRLEDANPYEMSITYIFQGHWDELFALDIGDHRLKELRERYGTQ